MRKKRCSQAGLTNFPSFHYAPTCLFSNFSIIPLSLLIALFPLILTLTPWFHTFP